MPEKTDEEIARLVQAGDNEAFGLLVERYEQKMLRYAKRFLFGYEEAKDQIQEVFLKAFENIQGFDTEKRFSPWLYRIAHNSFINMIKKKRREPMPFFDPDTIFPHPVADEQPDDEIKKAELREEMETLLDQVSPKYREPLVLYYYESLSYKDIADVLRVPVSTVGVRINRGKKLLEKLFKQHERSG